MWTRKNLKDNAKQVLKRSYWMCLLVCLIVGLIVGELDLSKVTTNLPMNTDTIGNGFNFYVQSWNGLEISFPVVSDFFLGVVLTLIAGAFVFSILLGTFLFDPLRVGRARYFLNNMHGDAEISDIFSVFTDGNYLNIVKIMFVRNVNCFYGHCA